jgi:hypothetical protein
MAALAAGSERLNKMKAMRWICIATGLALGAAALVLGDAASGLLVVALLLLCCGGMLFGRKKAHH